MAQPRFKVLAECSLYAIPTTLILFCLDPEKYENVHRFVPEKKIARILWISWEFARFSHVFAVRIGVAYFPQNQKSTNRTELKSYQSQPLPPLQAATFELYSSRISSGTPTSAVEKIWAGMFGASGKQKGLEFITIRYVCTSSFIYSW